MAEAVKLVVVGDVALTVPRHTTLSPRVSMLASFVEFESFASDDFSGEYN